MVRRCSHCSNNGHNSRTCPAARAGSSSGGEVRLFGVRLTDRAAAVKKSASLGNLSPSSSSSSSSSPDNNPGSPAPDPTGDHGYASDDPAHASSSRKKGTPWSEQEHKLFLLGLRKLGKGDWRGISRNFVVSRTPTQVASHAQKYFIRQTTATRRKRRSSLFDMASEIPETKSEQLPALDEAMHKTPPCQPADGNQLPSPLDLSRSIAHGGIPLPPRPVFFPTLIPIHCPFWRPPMPVAPSNDVMAVVHKVVKPTPVLQNEARNIDEVARMSKLSIGEEMASRMEPSELSHKLLEASTSRHSAFRVSLITGDLSPTTNLSSPIHAV